MRRREFLMAPAMLAPGAAGAPEPHFPSRLHQFVWRNWELANIESMAAVAGCTPAQLIEIGRHMVLPPKPRLTSHQLRRIYITVIRQNWSLLPNDQITALLGWTPEKFDFTLREDDFLDVKLGPKPTCPPLRYEPPSGESRRRAAEIGVAMRETFGKEWDAPGEPPFRFIERLSAPGAPPPEAPGPAAWDLRFVYSHVALYGDPLLEPEIDPFPDGYLERLRAVGINGVWMQGLLRNMAPAKSFPEFGERWRERAANLRRLVSRAAKHGMRVFLYLNEPRAMPSEFFEKYSGMRGAGDRGVSAMCTSVPEVREWLAQSTAHVFREVPDLGGVFTITMSENLTNCHSKFRPQSCPRCSGRKSWEVVGEVLDAIHSGVRAASRTAEIVAWDWGWPEEMARNLIPKLPRDMRFQSVSEWSIPIERSGVKATVGEYSISVVGPGPRASAHWKLARERGLRTLAKTQFNNTWEISAVPYIPVGWLVARHCANLRKAGVSGVMASWTLGGYPSPNLEIAREFYFGDAPGPEEAVQMVAKRRYGRAAALVAGAWKTFSDAFEQFPYGVAIYTIPTQHGPANLLRAAPSGVRASMILFPQDDWRAWCGRYPPEVVRDQFARMAEMWAPGLAALRKAVSLSPAAAEDLAVAETCWIHFRSTANQLAFYLLRDSGGGDRARMRALVEDEIALARRQFSLARRHSFLAYEASNHYYYRPLDLAEKVLNCRNVLSGLGASV